MIECIKHNLRGCRYMFKGSEELHRSSQIEAYLGR